jgi:periplasmic protein CpxP/Spy
MEHKMIATRVSALALAVVLGVAAAASAQTVGSGYPPQRSQGRADWAQRRETREAEHLKALHDALNIRPDQEQAFQAYAASMRPAENGERPGGMAAQRLQLASMTTPERVDAMGRMMDERMQRMRERFQRHAAAVKALYAALGPEQRRTLDALPGLMGRGMGMGKDRGSMDRPRMGPPPAQPQ